MHRPGVAASMIRLFPPELKYRRLFVSIKNERWFKVEARIYSCGGDNSFKMMYKL